MLGSIFARTPSEIHLPCRHSAYPPMIKGSHIRRKGRQIHELVAAFHMAVRSISAAVKSPGAIRMGKTHQTFGNPRKAAA